MMFGFINNKKQEQQQAQYQEPAAIRGPDYGRGSLIRRTSERVMISERRLRELERDQKEKERKKNKVGVFDSIASATANINHGIQDALQNASDHMRRRSSNEEYSCTSYEGEGQGPNGDDSCASFEGDDGCLGNGSPQERRQQSQEYNDDDDDLSEEELQARRGSIMVSW